MNKIDIFLDDERKDPHGIPLIILTINGRQAIFAKQLASIFSEANTGYGIIKNISESGTFEEGEGYLNLSSSKLQALKKWETDTYGKSVLEKLYPSVNESGVFIVFEEAALWFLARSNSDAGKEFAKILVRTFIAVRDGDYIEVAPEDRKRIEERNDYTRATKGLNDTVYKRGLIKIGVFHAEGDKAFYGGKDTKKIKEIKGIPPSRTLADFDGSLVLRAKTFAKDLTEEAVKNNKLTTKEAMTNEYCVKNKQMRKVLTDVGIYPENTEKVEDIKKVKQRTRKYLQSKKGIKKLN